MEPLSDQIMERALERANEHFDEAVEEIVAMARGNLQALIQATDRLAKPRNVAGSSQHIAFTYVAAAFARVAEQQQPGSVVRKPPPG
jgi:hypothetical protein